MGWQDAVVALIVAGALAYLASRFVGPGARPRASRRPDVAVGSLVRRGRSGGPPRADRPPGA